MKNTQSLIYSIGEISTETILRRHAAEYEKMQPTDAVKLLYQASFGPGHMIADEKSAAERTLSEISSLNDCKCSGITVEDIGGGYARLYLTPDMAECADLVTRLFTKTANECNIDAERRKKFSESLETLKKLTDEGVFSFSSDELSQYLDEYAASGYPAVSHSDEYRTLYRPAYRVVKREFAQFFPILREIYLIAKANSHAVLAIDGFCASGKSTLAQTFSYALDARLIHMDDFFLPPEKRTPVRLSEPGGNVDYERFSDEVISHLSDNSLTYGVFDCSCLTVTSHRTLPRTAVTIIEGSYSCHPYFGDYADVTIFLDAPKDEQLRRIRLRDGEEMLESFITRWIPMEEKYEAHFGISGRCGYRITVEE